MAKNILVISCDFRETRAALIENGIIAELHIERKGREGGSVGNVYLGKVTRVLPGLQAAFIDIGQERAAFLHVEDLIRPDDFDEYLAGGRKLARGQEGLVPPPAEVGEAGAEVDEAAAADADEAAAHVADAPEDGGDDHLRGDDDDDDDDAAADAEDAADERSDSSEPPSADEAHADAEEQVRGEEAAELVAAGTAVQVSITTAAVIAETSGEIINEVESSPNVVLPGRPDDLETTVSYPNWPEPPSTKSRTDARRPRNGTTTARRALSGRAVAAAAAEAAQRSDSEAPSVPPPSSEPPSTESAPPSDQAALGGGESSTLLVAGGAQPSSRAVIEHNDDIEDDEDDGLDLDAEDDDDDDEVASRAVIDTPTPREGREGHSFHSAPTLDELPGDNAGDSDPPAATPAVPRDVATDTSFDDDEDFGDLPGFTVTEPGEPVPRAPAPRMAGGGPGNDRERGERGGRRRRRGRGGRGPEPRQGQGQGQGQGQAQGQQAQGGGGRQQEARGGGGGRSGGGDQRGRRDGRGRSDGRGGPRGGGDRRPGGGGGGGLGGIPGRLSKSTPIREVVKEGQEIIVQVTKDPIGTKGARCSSHISLPGRYVVYLPTVDHIGISKRIGNDKERARLREAIEAMKPPSGGLIVRTVAEGLTKKGLKQDVGYLVRLWGEIAKKREGARAPNLLSSELDLVLKVARDLFTDEVDEVVIDDKAQYERLCRFVEMFAPDRLKDVKHYDEEEPIFDEYGIEDEIGRALARKVPLPSGGYLIIDQAEALTAIDVNTGRFVGKGSKDMEETILKTNLEAVNEIAYQLRFRNIGGLIILDLIDMEQHKNRERVRRTLEELLHKDKAKTTLNRISDLGLIEMTRKRTRESLGRLMHEPCFYCDGTGQLQSKDTVAYEILREIRRKRSTLPGYSVVVNAHPAVADVLNGPEKLAVADAENKWMRKITVVPRKEYHLEQFDIQGR